MTIKTREIRSSQVFSAAESGWRESRLHPLKGQNTRVKYGKRRGRTRAAFLPKMLTARGMSKTANNKKGDAEKIMGIRSLLV